MYIIVFRLKAYEYRPTIKDHYVALESGTGLVMHFTSVTLVNRKFDIIRAEWRARGIPFYEGIHQCDPVAVEFEGEDLSDIMQIVPFLKDKTPVNIEIPHVKVSALHGWRGIPVGSIIVDDRKKVFMDPSTIL